MLCTISVWTGTHSSSSRGVTGRHLNKTNLRFLSQLLCNLFSHVCPFKVQVLDMSSVSHMGKLKLFLGNTSRGRHCAGVSPALPHQSQGDLNSKPGILWHYPQTVTREPQLDSGVQWCLLPFLPWPRPASPAPSSLSTTRQFSATQQLVFLKTVSNF